MYNDMQQPCALFQPFKSHCHLPHLYILNVACPLFLSYFFKPFTLLIVASLRLTKLNFIVCIQGQQSISSYLIVNQTVSKKNKMIMPNSECVLT